jgi:hypothetical protein
MRIFKFFTVDNTNMAVARACEVTEARASLHEES